MSYNRSSSLLGSLVRFTLLCLFAQAAFFFVHYRVADILDALAGATISAQWFQPALIWPIIGFIVIQLAAYSLFIAWVWFIAVSLGELLELSKRATYWLGINIWLVGWLGIFSLNHYFYPHSYFAEALDSYLSLEIINVYLLPTACISLLLVTLFAYVHFFYSKRYRLLGWSLLILLSALASNVFYPISVPKPVVVQDTRPNIIIIGLDSLRPDFIGHLGNQQQLTTNVDAFLSQAAIFTNAYSPLARTFPAWVSLLTAKFPLHTSARMNLQNPQRILQHATLAQILQANGYFTIYGSDEVRFSDITQAYGFDRVIRPKGGAAGFLLEGLQDFPLTNLLVNLPAGRWLFPYNYGNRGAHITYRPEAFLDLVQHGLTERPAQPLFLAVHFCLTHWPFTWAQDNQSSTLKLSDRYAHAVQAEDTQLGGLLKLLKVTGLLEHSIVVLLSDHGVTLGMPDDRIIRKENYRGELSKRKVRTVMKLNTAPSFSLDLQHDYALHTSYGQGTDVLSPKQNHILLAMKGYGVTIPAHMIHGLSSLLDITPTLLDYLHLPALKQADGQSLLPYLQATKTVTIPVRPFFIETGDKFAEMERSDVDAEKVMEKGVHAYELQNGYLTMKPEAVTAMVASKQRAVIFGDFLLARYPAERGWRIDRQKGATVPFRSVTLPPYFVLVNLKTKLWTTDLTSHFARTAPLSTLKQQLLAFYAGELAPT